jgi:2-polyprenyl-3-methyl-5-hydroxy-6-metoxy-1,4-benzoquinol methylase
MTRLVLLEAGEELRWKLLEPLPPLREADILRVRSADGAVAGVERGGAVLRPDRGLGRLLGPRYWSTALDALELLRRLRHPWTPPLFQGTTNALLVGVRDKYDVALEAEHHADMATGELVDVERELVERHVPRGGRILDVGCGGGREAVGFARLGYEVVGIDVAPRMIAAARRSAARLGVDVDFRVASVTEVDASGECFDAVFFAGSLHHLPGRELRIRTLRRIAITLKPDGVLIVMVHYGEPRGLLSRSRLVDAARVFVRRAGLSASEPGDGYMREVSARSDPRRACFFHFFGGPAEIRQELAAAGFSADEVSRGWWICRPSHACATVGAATATSLTERSQR